MAEKDLVRLRTERFRTSLDPLWVRIRRLLMERELDPLSMALAYFEPEDFKLRFGIFADSEGRVFEFGFDFAGRKSTEGNFSEWEEITDRVDRSPFREPVEHALRLLDREKGSRR